MHTLLLERKIYKLYTLKISIKNIQNNLVIKNENTMYIINIYFA